MKPNDNATKPNEDARKNGADARKPNANAKKPNADARKPNANAKKSDVYTENDKKVVRQYFQRQIWRRRRIARKLGGKSFQRRT